jgi:hypothetical protein
MFIFHDSDVEVSESSSKHPATRTGLQSPTV